MAEYEEALALEAMRGAAKDTRTILRIALRYAEATPNVNFMRLKLQRALEALEED